MFDIQLREKAGDPVVIADADGNSITIDTTKKNAGDMQVNGFVPQVIINRAKDYADDVKNFGTIGCDASDAAWVFLQDLYRIQEV